MLTPRTTFDPDGYYARLGLATTATQAAIVSAYRAKARLLHPDVPKTGDTSSFVLVKQAYDVLSNQERREVYDRRAREAAVPTAVVRTVADPPRTESRQPRFSDLPVAVWGGLAALLALGVYEVASDLMTPSPVEHAEIRANAATIAPLSPSDRHAVLYGPAPVQLAGTPNFYVKPSGTPAILWRLDVEHNTLEPLGQLPPFSVVQAVRLIRDKGMLEVLLTDKGNGFVSADHLTAGNTASAWLAYCSYNAGPAPFNGELLERHGSGTGKLTVHNHALQPVVVKLRDAAGTVAAAVFLDAGGHADLDGLPEVAYRPEFAIGELWSRACNVFAAGMQARRLDATLRLPGDSLLVLAPDAGKPAASDISDQAFGKN